MNKCNNQENKVYKGIDLFKLIASVLIVLLHTIETTNFYACEIKYVFTRFAVPFFFICSGYFFYKGLDRASNKKYYFYRYEKNLLKLFGLWALLIYSPFEISSYINNNKGESLIKIILLLVRRIFIIGPGPFWYIMALMLSILYIFFCYRIKKDQYIILAMIIGFILQIMYASFQQTLSNIYIFKCLFKIIYYIYSWEFNFIMYGIPFCGIGYYICKKNIQIKMKFSCLIFICSTILRVLEYNIPYIFPNIIFFKNDIISLAFIPQSISYFLIALDLKLNIQTRNSLIMRELSSFIYFSHAIILYNILNPILDKYFEILVYDPKFIATKIIIILSICLCLFGVIKKINNKYLNSLINA